MAAEPVSVVYEVEVQLVDVFEQLPLKGTRVLTEWVPSAPDEPVHTGRTAVLMEEKRLIGYLPARYDAITSIVCCEGIVTDVVRSDEPVVMVRLRTQG